ncbi:MAG TPA: hypothetical protein VLB84_00655 [Bacteroidia bacterium]|jgi:hypothetical protein|nr:hypothetical protein [Bacteroidia bacterium]
MKNLFFLFFFIPVWLLAQQNRPLNRQWELYENEKIQPDTSFISCFKPRIVPSLHPEKYKTRSLLYRKIKKENLLIVNDSADKFCLTIDPLFNLELGRDLADTSGENLYKNTRGFLLRGYIGEKFAFESSFYENQATFANYIDEYIVSTDNLFPSMGKYNYNVIPGQGRSKKFKSNGYDFAMASGYISYSPTAIFNIQIGHGKHFVGDGYRSLLLSDNAFNYPYARITTTFKNIQYTNLYTSFMNLTSGGDKIPPGIERLFQKKIGNFQMLNIRFWERLNVGLFQGMIWEAADSTNREHVNFNTFDPVIGVNALTYGLHHSNNVLLGLTLKINITRSFFLYGQFLLDDLNSKDEKDGIRKKYGYQAGFKYIDAFTLKNLTLQGEYNSVRPYTYASENPEQSYSHYNQALAHPLGANFIETIGIINYRMHDFFTEIKLNYAIKGKDSLFSNFGGSVFNSDSNVSLPPGSKIQTKQGVATTIVYQDLHIGYLINPVTNLNMVIGFSNRMEKANGKNRNTQFVYVGIRTSLANFYYDF